MTHRPPYVSTTAKGFYDVHVRSQLGLWVSGYWQRTLNVATYEITGFLRQKSATASEDQHHVLLF